MCFSKSILYVQIFVMWLDFVTYLHHHGHEQKLPWYRGKVCIISNTHCWYMLYLELPSLCIYVLFLCA